MDEVNNKVSILIKDGSYLSLKDIHQLKDNNCSILRSAHVGNLDAQTLFLAKEGFSIILDEYARGSMRVYRPAYKIQYKKETALSNRDDLPVSNLYLTNKSNKYNNCVAFYHYKNLASLFPDSIKLTSSHLLNHKTLVYKSLQILSQKRPNSFLKLIEEDGNVFKFTRSENEKIYFRDDLGSERVFYISQLPDLVMAGLEYTERLLNGEKIKYSPIITLDVDADVSLITLCDIDWNNIDNNIKAIHFAGLEMINYMVKDKQLAPQHSKAMNEIFNLLIHIWTKTVPEEIEILIIPTDSLHCFICETEKEEKILNDALLSNTNINKLLEKRTVMWKKHQKETSEYVLALSNQEIVELIKNLEPIDNSPQAFIKTVYDIKKKINEGLFIERKKLNKIEFNYLLYKNMDTIGIHEIESNITKEKEIIQKSKTLIPASLTQYDLLNGKNIYFPELARSMSANDLKIFYRGLKKDENRIKL